MKHAIFERFLCLIFLEFPFKIRNKIETVGSTHLFNHSTITVQMLDKAPELSVVIPVYNRSEFVNDAIKSVIDLSKETSIEILVVSNINLSLEIESKAIRLIRTDIKSLSKKLEIGIRESSASIVAFLEDDDLWCNNKINELLSVFRKNKQVDFYHNGSKHFRGEVCDAMNNSNSGCVIIKRAELDDRNSVKPIKLAIKNNIGYNLSSIAVRKSAILDHLDILTSLSVYGIDSLVAIISLIYCNNIFIDRNIRTCVRVHKSNSYRTLFTDNEKFISELDQSRKLISSNDEGITLYIELFFTSTYIVFYSRINHIKRYSLLSASMSYIGKCVKLGIFPASYILVTAFSRIISFKLYSYILKIYHS